MDRKQSYQRLLDQKQSYQTQLDQNQLDQKTLRSLLVKGYQSWVISLIDERWKPYEISFMYNQLPGSRSVVLEQMKQEIYRVYARLVTRFHRNPRSAHGFECLPRMMLFPDLPVFKHKKKSIEDVSINDGLHYGGICLTPPVSRFRGKLDDHFRADQEACRSAKVARVLAFPITNAPGYVTDYVMKSIKAGRTSMDQIP